jgi:hypothetical protein
MRKDMPEKAQETRNKAFHPQILILIEEFGNAD